MLHFLITTALLLLGGGDLPDVLESGPNKIVDHAAVVEALLQAGADIDKAAKDGATALIMASQGSHTAVV